MLVHSYHPDWHDKIIPVKGAQSLCHTENCTCTDLQRRFINNAEYTGKTLVGRYGLFDFQREELSVVFQKNIYFFGVTVAVKVNIRLFSFEEKRHSSIPSETLYMIRERQDLGIL